MKHFLLSSLIALAGFLPSAFADSDVMIISVNKSVALENAEAAARSLEHQDPSEGTCYFQSKLDQYIPYQSCETDSSCPYWGVAIVSVEWNCGLSNPALLNWLSGIKANPNFQIYDNGVVEPFPIISGGN